MEKWIQAILDAISPVELTIRAQALPIDDQGRLNWGVYFPRRNVNSMKLRELVQTDFRPVADRRQFDAEGRLYAPRTPEIKELEFRPIEMYHLIGEEEMQDLAVRFSGNAALMRSDIGVDIEDRVDAMVLGDFRRVELDVFQAWSQGTITTKDPATAATRTVSYGFDASRYQTAGTTWDLAADAYNELMAWIEDGEGTMGPIGGVVIRRATLKVVKADAPQPLGVEITTAELQERVADELGHPFRFVIMEETLEPYNDGGLTTTSTKVWPSGIVAAFPPEINVGTTGFAPVLRAYDVAGLAADNEIDVRGATVYRHAINDGKGVKVQAQLNAFPLPDEQKLWVMDAGV